MLGIRAVIMWLSSYLTLAVLISLAQSNCPKLGAIRPCSCRTDNTGGLVVKCLQSPSWKSLKSSLKPFKQRPIASLLVRDILDSTSSTHLVFDQLIIDDLTIDNCQFRKNRLSPSTFRGANVIFLTLTNLQLTKVPSKPLKPLAELVSLNLANNQLTKVSRLAFRYQSASLKSLGLSHNLLSEFPLKALRKLPQLEMLDLSNNQLTEVPSMAFTKNLQLIILQLSNNRLTTMAPGAFKGVEQLKFLGLSENLFTGEVVEMQQLVNLESVELSNVKLDLRSLLLANLTLKSLVAQNSRLSNGFLMAFFQHLTELDLSYNRGLNDHLNIFSRPDLTYPNVERLDISGSDLFPIALPNFPNLQELYASWNSIPSINAKMFRHQKNLRKLELKVCSIRRLSNLSFRHNPKLTTINLSFNELSKVLPDTFTNLKMLKELNLANNQIRLDSINVSVGTVFPGNLESLSLANNQLRQIPHSLLAPLLHLSHLNLAGNHIGTVDSEFQSNVNLISLVLRNNLITSVSRMAFAPLTRLSHLDLSANRLKCISRLKIPSKLKFFDRRHNPLQNSNCSTNLS